ncbi:MAG: DUF2309 domain-containing protein [Sandaracinaceae bacterium]|nr:DUF2309 domain-containing protein [Sandaracinaceae bacterium]
MSSGPERISHLLDEVSHLLPAQGPISVFIHHNTLHAFEDQPFEEAVVEAGRKLGCAPFLSEARYREELARGRIAEADVAAVLEEELGERGRERIAGRITRLELRRRMTLHGIPEASGAALSWLLAESPALRRFRAEAAYEAWEHLEPSAQEAAVRALFEACLEAAQRATPRSPTAPRAPVRHQALLLAAHGIDTDDLVNPVLIRFTAAYLDQGLAQRSMPGRERGMYACFLELYGSRAARLAGAWAGALPALVAEERRGDLSAEASIAASLEALGVPEAEQHDYLLDTALALRGWAGMVRQLEQRPDRVPAHELPARLADFLAVRLLLERVALAHAARSTSFEGPLCELRASTCAPRSRPRRRRARQTARGRSSTSRSSRGSTPRRSTGSAPRRSTRSSTSSASSTASRAAGCCTSPTSATCGTASSTRSPRTRRAGPERAGHPGVLLPRRARGVVPAAPRGGRPRRRDARHRRLLRRGDVLPRRERRAPTAALSRGRPPRALRRRDARGRRRGAPRAPRAARRRARGAVHPRRQPHAGARLARRHPRRPLRRPAGPARGVPVARETAQPRARAPSRAPTRASRWSARARRPPSGRHSGFTIEEQVSIVGTLLENAGVARLAPLVIVLGHGSVSLNNPHESAHDCGACGGGHGGPNARAFAQMANDPACARGSARPDSPSTRGRGSPAASATPRATRSSSSISIACPTPTAPCSRGRGARSIGRAPGSPRALPQVRARARLVSPLAAAMHVEGRAADLAQPRPEYGHATNAFCVVGRRARTRGLFFDRRAFLVSYDPTRDPSGAVLERLLGAVVPVVAGISLEYWFGYVDPIGYGCGTKLPHNVTSLLGVMDGAASDLRTGLPWQMLEIHEPVRLTMVIEREPLELERILRASPTLSRLVLNRWITLACLDPSGAALFHYGPHGLARYEPERPLEAVVGGSVSAYRGERGPPPFVRIAS